MKPSASNVWIKTPGWCTNNEGDYLHFFASTCPKKAIIVDIGTYYGKSAAALGLGCLASGARVISIDHFKGNPEHSVKPSHEAALISLERIDPHLLDVVTIVPTDALEFANKLTKPIYAVYIDSEHSRQVILDTFVAYWKKLISKGHVMFHDAAPGGWPVVISTVKEIAERWPMDKLPGDGSIMHYRKIL